MREINAERITEEVSRMCISANYFLNNDVYCAMEKALESEISPVGREMLSQLIKNADIAKETEVPICQDTGLAVVFVTIGQDVHIVGGSLKDAINEGVRKGYTEGYLRKSVVADPFIRVNTKDNTPAIIHTRIVPGDKISFTVAPKGFGSENMSRIKMFNPTATKEDIVDFVVSVVRDADAKPCPPLVIGVGIGGDFEYSACLSKKALCRSTVVRNENPFYAEMEGEITKAVNETGIGPQGFSGDCTALACNIEVYPTHIAGLPVAVNIGCHVTRHISFVI